MSSQGGAIEYDAVQMPKSVVGLTRHEFLQTCSPQNMQVTQLARQRQQSECYTQLDITDEPDIAHERGAQIGDALTDFSQQRFQVYCPLGPFEPEKQELIDGWIQILCIDYGENNLARDNWLAFVFLAWGDHWLPDIIAEFLDGEAEKVVDELYANLPLGCQGIRL